MPDAPTRIQEAVAWLREMAGVHHDVPDAERWLSWADAIEAQGREIERLREAGWQPIETAPKGTQLLFWWIPKTPNRHAEKCVFAHISSYEDGVWWNGQIGAYQSIKHLTHWMPLPEPLNPTDAHPTADRNTALNTTPLPASAPPLGPPALEYDTWYSEAYVIKLLAALKAARDLIAKDRNEIAEVAELTEFFGGGEWRKDRNVAEYDDVLTQIDEVMK